MSDEAARACVLLTIDLAAVMANWRLLVRRLRRLPAGHGRSRLSGARVS